ncbi:major facilitator transporter [Chania multitudinisentens RB-25]|uniref:Major facilitator transporter n=1 Tax=Chania multitudinisentens RB-25 TaxID=1441930 RepID=W0L9T1_9GAMM|nr:MFS transporter [Chania multitudinisentens]AHG18765.1 major facilitator transporter [Chania multitudinisentens RB-25]
MITNSIKPLGEGRVVTLGHQLAYGGGNLLGSGALAISGAWLLYFYTTFCGLTLLEASFIFSVASVIDAISNPVMGYLTDNFGHTWLGKRFGRRRFFVLIGAPLMIFYPLLWVEGFGFWYYLSTYVIFELIYTSVMVPYETLATEMTEDFAVRSKLTGYKAIFGKMANFLAAFIPGQFILIYGKESAQPFLYTGITYGLILFIAIGMLYLFSWERQDEGETLVRQKSSLLSTLMSLARDMQSTFYLRVFRKHLGMYLFGFGAEWLFASVFTYFVIFVLQYDPAILAGLNSLNAMLQLFSTALFIGLCVKKGFSKPYIWALGIVVFAVCCYTLLPFFNLPAHFATAAIIGVTVIFGLGTGGVYYIPWTVYTFLADVDEVFTGRRREGIYAGAMTFSGKIVRSIIVFTMGAILSYYGFQSKSHTQPETAITAISWVFFAGVIVLALVAIVFSSQMTLNRQTHRIVLDEVARIKAGGKLSDIQPEVRLVIEKLVGLPYEQCWGNSKICQKMKLAAEVQPTMCESAS